MFFGVALLMWNGSCAFLYWFMCVRVSKLSLNIVHEAHWHNSKIPWMIQKVQLFWGFSCYFCCSKTNFYNVEI